MLRCWGHGCSDSLLWPDQVLDCSFYDLLTYYFTILSWSDCACALRGHTQKAQSCHWEHWMTPHGMPLLFWSRPYISKQIDCHLLYWYIRSASEIITNPPLPEVLQCRTLKNGLSGPGSVLTLAAWDFRLGRKVGSKSVKMQCPKIQESRD
jgi:hypothetical protein